MEPLELFASIPKVAAPDTLLFKVQHKIKQGRRSPGINYVRIRVAAALLSLMIISESAFVYKYMKNNKEQPLNALVPMPHNSLYE